MEGVRIISRPGPVHHCPTPGWWARRKARIEVGTVVECLECGQQWEWSYGYECRSWVERGRHCDLKLPKGFVPPSAAVGTP